MKARLSIIIPAYNAAKTVQKAVESVLAQTMTDLEVWVVNDGSTDETALILEQLKKNDDRVKVIHQDNQGAYMARLQALQRINTPYFSFIDADDSILPYAYEKVFSVMSSMDIDVLKYDEVGRSDDTGKVDVFTGESNVYEKVYIPWLVKGNGAATIWNMVYKNKYDFSNFKKCNITMFDDLMLNLQFFKDIKSYGHLHIGLYNYSYTEGSAVHSFTKRHIHDFKEIVRCRNELISDKVCNASWTLKNLRGMIISAISAKANFSSVITNIKKLLFLPEVQSSLMYVPRDKFYIFYKIASVLPTGVFVLAMKFVLCLHKLWR